MSDSTNDTQPTLSFPQSFAVIFEVIEVHLRYEFAAISNNWERPTPLSAICVVSGSFPRWWQDHDRNSAVHPIVHIVGTGQDSTAVHFYMKWKDPSKAEQQAEDEMDEFVRGIDQRVREVIGQQPAQKQQKQQHRPAGHPRDPIYDKAADAIRNGTKAYDAARDEAIAELGSTNDHSSHTSFDKAMKLRGVQRNATQ